MRSLAAKRSRGPSMIRTCLRSKPSPRGGGERMAFAGRRTRRLQVDPRFEVNLFASEEQFPDLAKNRSRCDGMRGAASG